MSNKILYLFFIVILMQFNAMCNTFTAWVGYSEDDAMQKTDSSVSITDTSLYRGISGTTAPWVGVRFRNVGIPPYATISKISSDSSYLWFTGIFGANCASGGNVYDTIYGHDTANSVAFSASNYDLSRRVKTTAKVTNMFSVIGSGGDHNANTKTVDISSVIQEIVDRSDWGAGNSMSFLLHSTSIDWVRFIAKDNTGSAHPCTLHIYYTTKNLAGGKTVTVSSTNGGNSGSNAVDGNTGTRWESTQGVDPQWIYVDLGTGYYVKGVFIDWETASSNHYTIDGSNDASNWTTIKDTTDGASFQHRYRSFKFTPTYYRYIRVYGYNRTTTYGHSIWELEVYGDTNHAPTDISLSNSSQDENTAINTTIGTLSCTDAENNTNVTYSLVATGDYASFNISGTSLRNSVVFDYETKNSYNITIRVTDEGGLYYDKAFTITVNNVNETPTDISLSASSVNEGEPIGTVVGTFSTTDPDVGQSFTYTLVSGTGSTDNDSFTISGNQLKTAKILDYDNKNPLSIRVRSTDNGSPSLYYEKTFNITINFVNYAPTDITLSNNKVYEGKPLGTRVATLFTTDANANDYHTYSLVSGAGSDDNGSFSIINNCLYTAAVFDYETKSTYSIRIRTTDNHGSYYEEAFTIYVMYCGGTCVDDYSQWPYWKYIYLNTTATGANVSNDVDNFPVLIRLNPSNFSWFNQTRPGGTDIRFAKEDGTHLPYEIERWVDNAGDNDTAEIWVKIPRVYGNNNLQRFKMLWGKSDAADSSNGAAVFETSNGFVAVYHFKEKGTQTRYNSAQNNYNAKPINYDSDESKASVIGLGDSLETNDYDSLGNITITSQITLSCWAKPADFVTYGKFINKQWSTNANPWQTYSLQMDNNSPAKLNMNVAVNGTHYGPTTSSTLSLNQWNYLTGTFNGSSAQTYLNGLADGSPWSASGTISTTSTNTTIGRNDTVTSERFNGVIDEVRIENVARSADWIKLCYENQKINQTLVDLDDYREWSYSKDIRINTTISGANISTSQYNFPLLVRLNEGNFTFSEAQDSGQDIRFAKSNGAHLTYEIERWDRANRVAEIWVRIDTVYGNNGSQYFTMYWGKSGVGSRSNGNIVFDTANGFVAVWHLSDENKTTGYTDATYNGLHATGNNMAVTDTITSVIGKGQTFNGSNKKLSVSSGINLANSNMTLSAWAKFASAPSSDQYIISQGTASADQGLHFGYNNTATKFTLRFYTDDLDQTNSYSGGTNWQYVAGTYQTSDKAQRLYMNGVQDNNRTATANYSGTGTLYIGSYLNGTQNFWNGYLDEVRVEKVTRSADWIKLCYENQKPDQKLLDTLLEDYNQWAFKRKIYINTTSLGMSGNVVKFPYLVRLNSGNFDFNQAKTNGEDIRFSKWNGTKFWYQIERWDKANSAADIWVLVDTIYANNSTQYFWMYWGKSDALDRSNGKAVFDTANGFRGVWHLGPTIAANDTFNDATYNGLNGTNNNSTSGDGISGKSRYFNQVGSTTVSVADNVLLEPDSITVMCWAKRDGAQNSYAKIFCKGSNASPYASFTLEMRVADTMGFQTARTAGTPQYVLTENTVPSQDATWYLLTGTFDKTTYTQRFYINGVQVASTTSNTNPIYYYTADYPIRFGSEVTDINPFKGWIDEASLARCVRSADWIKLCYYNQMPNSTITEFRDSADAFRPLGIKRYYSGSTLDSIYVGTSKWAIKFSRNMGGGIKFLAKDSTSTNQINKNMFYLVYNTSHSSDTGTGTITLLDSSIVFARVRQQKSVYSQPFTIDYTILGSGRIYVRVTTLATSNIGTGLEFRIANNATANYKNIYYGSSASNCSAVLHVDSGSGKYDLLMVPFENWTQATDLTGSSYYGGIKSTSWALKAPNRQSWEYMIDFSHSYMHDSTEALKYINDYRNPDTLVFYAGTPLLENAWENRLMGHWKFDEGSGDSVYDASGGGNTARIRGTARWTNGKWVGGDSLSENDSITIAPNTSLDGTYMGGFVILGWVKLASSLSSSSNIIKKYSSSNSGYKLTGNSNGQLVFTISNAGTSQTLTSKNAIPTGVWCHIGAQLTWNRDTMKIYVNGVLDTLKYGSFVSYISASSDSVVIGKGLNGVVDDIRFYSEFLPDEAIRAIYLRGYSPNLGMYSLRSENDNTLNCDINGRAYQRILPVFQIKNYWATSLPSYVYIDGVQLTNNVDYYAAMDDWSNMLTIGFNRTINAKSNIFIDDNSAIGISLSNKMPKMYWGTVGSSPVHFYVKNFCGNYFGSSSAKQFYIDFKMDSASTSRDGEMYRLKTSKRSPYNKADTTTSGNLLPTNSGSDTGATFGALAFQVSGGNYLSSCLDAADIPTYTLAESSYVRLIIQLGKRALVNGSSVCSLVTRWTIYPTGQIFRWDSIFYRSNTLVNQQFGVFQKYENVSNVRQIDSIYTGGIWGTSNLQDFAMGLLTSRNGGTNQNDPFTGLTDTVAFFSNSSANYAGVKLQGNVRTWSIMPRQLIFYQDISRASISSAAGIDSVIRGVKNFQSDALTMTTGTLVKTSVGDFGGDGFNEREGAYIIDVSNSANTARFTLKANGPASGGSVDTCRFYPAFRLTGYYAAGEPQYVFVGGVLKAKDYGYNVYHNKSRKEVIIQLNEIICSNTEIYISYDRTLAVTMSGFEARPGDGNDTLLWKTESEEQNLGFYIYRRVKPAFIDSLFAKGMAIGEIDTLTDDNAMICLKKGLVSYADTGWKLLSGQIIPGAKGGTSYGPMNYSIVDYGVHNDILYEYMLVSVDYNNQTEVYKKYAEVKPGKILPKVFELKANYPNPFKTYTVIHYSVPVKTKVNLYVYNLQGRIVRKLIDYKVLTPGFYKVKWDAKDDYGRNVATGPYIYRLNAPMFTKAKIMILAK